MKELTKVRDISLKYGISARALKYYEDMGLITSGKSDDYAYRMYDEEAVKRLEQILILRKLNISIKDIQRIFSTPGSEIVLEVLSQKVDDIDEEVALLHELKGIVLEFIKQINQADFSKDSDVKLLYEKAKEIEGQIVNVEYNGNPATINRLIEVADKLEKLPDVRIVEIPACKMVSSGLGKTEGFDKWFCEYDKKRVGIRTSPLDFMFFDLRHGGFVWWYAVEDWVTEADTDGYEIVDFEGGLYATAMTKDDGDTAGVYWKVLEWIEQSEHFEAMEKGVDLGKLDDKEYYRHTTFCHILTPPQVKKAWGYARLELMVPIKLRSK